MHSHRFGTLTLFTVLALAGCAPSAPDAMLVGTWHKHDAAMANGDSYDIQHEFRADGTVVTTINQYTTCSGTTPIPTVTTRTWSVDGNHVTFTVMNPDSCGAYPILACLSDTGVPCADLPTETMSFSVANGMLTLVESAHGRENGTYTQ